MGRLTAWKVGNKMLTSQAEVTTWLDRCRVDASQPWSGPLGAASQGRPTEAYLAASQAHLRLQLERIKEEARAKKEEARAKTAGASTRRQPLLSDPLRKHAIVLNAFLALIDVEGAS